MDVRCTNCGEPWDQHHLRHDEIWETDLPESVKEKWDGKLTPKVLKAFEANGWKFLGSLYAIQQCPGCKDQKPTKASKARAEMASVLADVLGDDADGLVSELSDLEDFMNF